MTDTATAIDPSEREILDDAPSAKVLDLVIARHPSGWWRSADGQWHRPDRNGRDAQAECAAP